MKRAVLTIVATVTGLVLLLQFKTQPAAQQRQVALAPAAPAAGVTASPSPSSTRSSRSTRVAKPTRTLLGQAVSTRYGPVQVRVTMTGNRIADVTAVQLPSGDGRSIAIASGAVPVLRREAISADSAHIDIVSGATYTSDGYALSLQSALDRSGD